MPSAAVSVQAACGFGGPGATSQRHMRQAPTGGAEPRLVTEDGDLDPGRERRLDEPGALRHRDLDAVDGQRDELGRAHACASTPRWWRVLWPTGRATPSSGDSSERAAAAVEVRDELVAELVDVARDRHRGGVAERAEATCRGCGRRRSSSRSSSRSVAVAGLELARGSHHPARALAARRALPARLVLVELVDAERELHHAAALVEHDHAAEPKPCSSCAERVVVEPHVDLVGGQRRHATSRRGSRP